MKAGYQEKQLSSLSVPFSPTVATIPYNRSQKESRLKSQVGKRDLSPLMDETTEMWGGDKSLFPTCDL